MSEKITTPHALACLHYILETEFNSYQEYLSCLGYEWEGVLSTKSGLFQSALYDETVDHVFKSAVLALREM